MIVGVYGGLAGLAVALGPVVGGLVTPAIDWHWISWLNVPIGIVATLLGLRLLPESHGAPERVDLVGVGLITAGAVALVWALARSGEIGWSSSGTVITLAAGVALLAAFLVWESRVSEPMVSLRLFAVREFAVGNLTSFLMSGAIFAAAFFVTQEFQFARGYSPLGAALRRLPFFATPLRLCSSRLLPGRYQTASAADRSWSRASPCRQPTSSGSPLAARLPPAGSS